MSMDQTTILQFIFLYRQHEVLWNPKDKSYYDSKKKDQAWNNISGILQIDINSLQKKMESLRGSYRREKSRLRHKWKISETEDCSSQWYAFEAMSFLDSRNSSIKNEKISIPKEIKTEYDFLDIEDHNLKKEVQEDRNDEEKDPLLIEVITPKPNNQSQESSSTKRKKIEELKTEENYSYSEKDGCILFGEYISNKLKKLDADLRASAEHKINNTLFELEMIQIKRRKSDTKG